MKKILLSAAAVAISLVSYAQCDDAGVSAKGFFDDFNTSTEYGNEDLGLYYWGDATPSAENNNFTITYDRDSSASSLGLLIGQSYNQYTPTGAGFGDTEGDGTGTLNTIDLSSDGTFSVEVTNDGDSSIIFRLGLKDNVGKSIDSYALPEGEVWGEAYKHSIEFRLDAGETITASGDFTGGVYADYANAAYDASFDMTNVEAVLITVINGNNTGDAATGDKYAPYALVDYPVSLANLKVGACPVIIGLSDANEVAYNVYPNPATDNVQFSTELTDVTVFDAIGNVIETSSKSSNLNVSSYNTGLYFIKSAEGTTQFMVK